MGQALGVPVEIATGDIFASGCQTIVNPINTVGAMGAGLALAFKTRFPDHYVAYRRRYDDEQLRIGEPYLDRRVPGPWIIGFPTKRHWTEASRLSDIDGGLGFLAERLEDWGVTSLAMPALGCGLGGLDWDRVRELITAHLDALDLSVLVYAPRT